MRVSSRLSLCAAAAAIGCGPNAPDIGGPADLVLLGGRVVTVDPAHPEAEAIAVRNGRIAALGSTGEIEGTVGPDTEVIELDGRLAIPGFIEGHGHFMGVGDAQMILKLGESANWNRIVDQVAEAVAEAPPGSWIEGRGWHQEKWDEVPPGAVEGLPHHLGLSEVSPENPVLLRHASGHAAFANALAMELAGIGRNTADPPGGTIVRDAEGNATGALRETAQRLVARARDRAMAERSEEDRRAELELQLELAAEESLRKGVTSFQDAGSSFEMIAFFREMAEAGRLPVRLYVMVRGESNEELDARLPDFLMTNHANGFLTVRSIKRQVDGALGAHGAWLLEPYDDMPSSAGLVLEEVADIEETARIAIRRGFQVNTHAIGDRGNREILDAYQRVFEEAGVSGSDLRFRIEHAQHLHPDDIPRFGELGVIASMQAVHATSDGPWVPEKLGDERARTGAYVWRSLLDSGAVVTKRDRCAGRGPGPDSELPRDRGPQAGGRQPLLSGRGAGPRGGAVFLHDGERLRRLRGGGQGEPDAGQVCGHRRADEGHPHRAGGGDPGRRSGADHRRRRGRLPRRGMIVRCASQR